MTFIAEFLIMLVLAALIPVVFLLYRARLLKKERENQVAIIRAVYEAEERQKLSIANNLHDEIIPGLSLIVQNVDLNVIDFELNRFNISNIAMEKELALSSMDAIRTIALDLTPKVLMDLGLINALSSFVDKIRSTTYTVIIKNNSDFDEKLPFLKNDEISIYRACLEILKNIQKHDNFKKLEIKISNTKEELIIRFSHDGAGITDKEIKSKTETSAGLGLKSLQSRLLVLEATLTYKAQPCDSEILFTIPIHNGGRES